MSPRSISLSHGKKIYYAALPFKYCLISLFFFFQCRPRSMAPSLTALCYEWLSLACWSSYPIDWKMALDNKHDSSLSDRFSLSSKVFTFNEKLLHRSITHSRFGWIPARFGSTSANHVDQQTESLERTETNQLRTTNNPPRCDHYHPLSLSLCLRPLEAPSNPSARPEPHSAATTHSKWPGGGGKKTALNNFTVSHLFHDPLTFSIVLHQIFCPAQLLLLLVCCYCCCCGCCNPAGDSNCIIDHEILVHLTDLTTHTSLCSGCPLSLVVVLDISRAIPAR